MCAVNQAWCSLRAQHGVWHRASCSGAILCCLPQLEKKTRKIRVTEMATKDIHPTPIITAQSMQQLGDFSFVSLLAFVFVCFSPHFCAPAVSKRNVLYPPCSPILWPSPQPQWHFNPSQHVLALPWALQAQTHPRDCPCPQHGACCLGEHRQAGEASRCHVREVNRMESLTGELKALTGQCAVPSLTHQRVGMSFLGWRF